MPADTNGRTLRVYVGLYGAEGKFQAYLSDHSAPAYTDTSLSSIYGSPPAVYILDYRAASSGQTLTVEYTANALFDFDYGNVSVEAATLSGASLPTNALPTVTITNPTNSAAYTAPASIPITAEASDSDGTVSFVEFFQNNIRLGAATNSPYNFNWTNVGAGNYTLTAKATDNLGGTFSSGPVNLTVTNSTPTPVNLLSPLASGNQFSFSFATESNRTYVIEHTMTLSPVNWQTMTNLVGNGSVVTATNSIQTETQQFFRVKSQ
jgi:hypothetical protein